VLYLAFRFLKKIIHENGNHRGYRYGQYCPENSEELKTHEEGEENDNGIETNDLFHDDGNENMTLNLLNDKVENGNGKEYGKRALVENNWNGNEPGNEWTDDGNEFEDTRNDGEHSGIVHPKNDKPDENESSHREHHDEHSANPKTDFSLNEHDLMGEILFVFEGNERKNKPVHGMLLNRHEVGEDEDEDGIDEAMRNNFDDLPEIAANGEELTSYELESTFNLTGKIIR